MEIAKEPEQQVSAVSDEDIKVRASHNTTRFRAMTGETYHEK